MHCGLAFTALHRPHRPVPQLHAYEQCARAAKASRASRPTWLHTFRFRDLVPLLDLHVGTSLVSVQLYSTKTAPCYTFRQHSGSVCQKQSSDRPSLGFVPTMSPHPPQESGLSRARSTSEKIIARLRSRSRGDEHSPESAHSNVAKGIFQAGSVGSAIVNHGKQAKDASFGAISHEDVKCGLAASLQELDRVASLPQHSNLRRTGTLEVNTNRYRSFYSCADFYRSMMMQIQKQAFTLSLRLSKILSSHRPLGALLLWVLKRMNTTSQKTFILFTKRARYLCALF